MEFLPSGERAREQLWPVSSGARHFDRRAGGRRHGGCGEVHRGGGGQHVQGATSHTQSVGYAFAAIPEKVRLSANLMHTNYVLDSRRHLFFFLILERL